MNSAFELRAACRAGSFSSPTGSMLPGLTQANLGIVPQAIADAFHDFMRANPAAFPVLARGKPGDPELPALGQEIDVRTDLPRYRVFRNGRLEQEAPNILSWWRDDLVAFAIGCSLSFEADLVAAGVRLRCHAPGKTCSAFDTSLQMAEVGPFGGNLVVSMRAIRADQVPLVEAITRANPLAHGGPIHVGDPAAIGVDLTNPIDGIGLTDVDADEVPVFWACGVSLERAINRAAPELAITHGPGHMLVTDLPSTFRSAISQPHASI